VARPAEAGRNWWRRHLSLSLRGLILLVVLIAATLGWVANRAAIQRESVDAIRKAGGKVWYDWEWGDPSPFDRPAPQWPSWLVNAVGVDYFSNVVSVSLSCRPRRA
jgi:hypothetical protein